MSPTIKLPTLLLVTKNPSIRSWIKSHLDAKFFIIESHKQSAIIDIIQHSKLDFIIIDGNIENCLELCKQIKSYLHLALPPIFLITGRLKKQFRDAAAEAGVANFLSEQLDEEELQRYIETREQALAIQEKTANLYIHTRSTHSCLLIPPQFHAQVVRLLKLSEKEKTATAFLLIQIDRFKTLQTELGHLAIDTLFHSFSQWMRGRLKKGDLLVPAADNRLVLLLRNTNLIQAKLFAETMRKEISKQRFRTIEGRSITVSVAYSHLEATESSLERIIDVAIRALDSQNDILLKLEPS